MKKYFTTDEMIEFLNDIDVVVEDSETEGMCEFIQTRLSSQSQHIDYLRSRLALAEHVIGELYLMQRETEE